MLKFISAGKKNKTNFRQINNSTILVLNVHYHSTVLKKFDKFVVEEFCIECLVFDLLPPKIDNFRHGDAIFLNRRTSKET